MKVILKLLFELLVVISISFIFMNFTGQPIYWQSLCNNLNGQYQQLGEEIRMINYENTQLEDLLTQQIQLKH